MNDPTAPEPTAPVETVDAPSPPWFRHLVFYTVLGGLCPLIPIPLLDDHVLGRVRRALIRELAHRQRAPVGESEVEMLADDPYRRGCGSCFLGLVITGILKLTVRVIAKLFRRITIVLVLKESVDTASHTFLQGYLLGLAFAGPTDRLPEVPELPWDRKETWKVTWALSAASREVDTKPLNRAIKKAFRGSWFALGKASRKLAGWVRRHPEEVDRDEVENELNADSESVDTVGGITDRIADRLLRERGTLEALEARFRAHLRAPMEEVLSGDRPPGQERPSEADINGNDT